MNLKITQHLIQRISQSFKHKTTIAIFFIFSVVPVLVVEYSRESLSVNDISQGIEIYPNPVTNQLTVSLLKLSNFNDVKTKVSLYSSQGQKLIETSPIKQRMKLDLSKFNSGVYVLLVKNDSNIT